MLLFSSFLFQCVCPLRQTSALLLLLTCTSVPTALIRPDCFSLATNNSLHFASRVLFAMTSDSGSSRTYLQHPIFGAAEHPWLPFGTTGKKMLRLGHFENFPLGPFSNKFQRGKEAGWQQGSTNPLIMTGNGCKGPANPVCKEIQPQSEAIAMSLSLGLS